MREAVPGAQRHRQFSPGLSFHKDIITLVRACAEHAAHEKKIYRQFDIFNRVSLYSAENTNRRQGLMSLTHYSSE